MTSKLHRQSDVTLTSQYDVVVTSWIAVTLVVATGTESKLIIRGGISLEAGFPGRGVRRVGGFRIAS